MDDIVPAPEKEKEEGGDKKETDEETPKDAEIDHDERQSILCLLYVRSKKESSHHEKR